MKRLLYALLLSLLTPALALGTPIRTLHHDVLLERQYSQGGDQVYLKYYNFCSGWLLRWQEYCGGTFGYPNPTVYGTCFDLEDTPGQCRSLGHVWYACYTHGFYARMDIQIYCADQNECPVGPPLAGVYDFSPPYGGPGWNSFDFGGLPLCSCEEAADGKFIVLITDYTASYESDPYSDANHRNIETGCESEWRCEGHSYVYGNFLPYCDVYGAPAPLWIDGPDFGCANYPTVPPWCHSFHDTGYYCEWLIGCYISCLGPTQTEEQSWSEIKALYR